MDRFMSRLAAFGVLIGGFATTAFAQNATCGMAVMQLQNYASQVNNVANMELYQGIPMRCGMNAYCRQALWQQLNGWYSQQAGMVNTWYAQIVQQCNQSSGGRDRPRIKDMSEDDAGEIDVSDLTVDNEDKTVRIRIPSTPRGFKR